MTNRTLPKIGTVLDLDGRHAVVIDMAGTYSRGTMTMRAVDRASCGHGPTGRLTGVHAQYLDTGTLVTIDRSSAVIVPTVGVFADITPELFS